MLKEFLNYLKEYFKGASYFKAGKLSAFLFCFIIASLFWFFQTLNEEYTEVVSFPIKYLNVPKGKAIINNPPTSIPISIKTSGNQLLKFKMFGNTEPVYVNLNKIKYIGNSYRGTYSIQLNPNLFQEQLGKKIIIKKIGFNVIGIDLERVITQRKQVKVNTQIEFEKQFGQSDYSRVSPSFVTVKGPESILNSLNTVNTELKVFHNTSKSIKAEIKLDNQNNLLKFSSSVIKFEMPVGKITEGKVKVKIGFKNLPNHYSAKLFPSHAEIAYLAPLNIFDKISSNDFVVEVDFAESNNYSEKRMDVKTSKYPDFVTVVRINPSRVEYLIQK